MIERMPRLIAVQAEGSPAIVRALEGDGIVRSYPLDVIADGISVSLPRNGAMAVCHIRSSGGFGITVSDEEILAAGKRPGDAYWCLCSPIGGSLAMPGCRACWKSR